MQVGCLQDHVSTFTTLNWTRFLKEAPFSCGVLIEGHPCLVVTAAVSKSSEKDSKGQ